MIQKIKQGRCALAWDSSTYKKVYHEKGNNTGYYYTGKNLVVIDLDSHKIPKEIKSILKGIKPTTITARGKHWYFTGKKLKYKNRTKLSSKQNIDIRGKGGKIFYEYTGKSKEISYEHNPEMIHKLDDHPKVRAWLDMVALDSKRVKPDRERGDVGKVPLKDGIAMLKNLKAKDYKSRDSWMQILAAYYHGVGDAGRDAAVKWSAKDKKNFNQSSFDQVWTQLVHGTYGGDISYGSLVHAVYGEGSAEDVADLFEEESESKGADKFNPPWALTTEALAERENEEVLFDQLIGKFKHSYIFGMAGSNKTTSMAWIGNEVVKKFPQMQVHFWSFDADTGHEKAIFDYVDDRFKLLVGATSVDFFKFYNDLEDLSEVLIIVDTFKHITENVNDKNANKKTMVFIKELCKFKKATVVSLGHTNKDGKKQSGTAEMEQDSDNIIRVRRDVDETNGSVSTTFTKAGRCRIDVSKGLTLVNTPTQGESFARTALETMRISSDVFNVEAAEEAEVKDHAAEVREKKDLVNIKEVVRVIKQLAMDEIQQPTQQMILNALKRDESLGKSLVNRLLREYGDRFWQWETFQHHNGGKPTKIYSLLPDGEALI